MLIYVYIVTGCVSSARLMGSNQKVIVKTTNRELHERGIALVNGAEYPVQENILMERDVMHYLTRKEGCPDSMVKYVDFHKRYICDFQLFSAETSTVTHCDW